MLTVVYQTQSKYIYLNARPRGVYVSKFIPANYISVLQTIVYGKMNSKTSIVAFLGELFPSNVIMKLFYPEPLVFLLINTSELDFFVSC